MNVIDLPVDSITCCLAMQITSVWGSDARLVVAIWLMSPSDETRRSSVPATTNLASSQCGGRLASYHNNKRCSCWIATPYYIQISPEQKPLPLNLAGLKTYYALIEHTAHERLLGPQH
ncbi:hypothetical protein KC340_g69 [Hortaea werneckii]|nr:hypothetical protein KC340_g69 [Hortaea werneckii]